MSLVSAILILFLLFLFGPLWTFLRAYARALKEKSAPETNIKEREWAGEDEASGAGALAQESKPAVNLMRQLDEQLIKEDAEMKKFKPFAYITEENIKRLSYMFLLRKEEPWVVAIVTSYLRSDLARRLLTSLPIDLQSKVALEALTVRQVTREQVIAIDNDVKENVDFVVGGIERLVSLLDELDSATRGNILNYLKNEKPLVYEAVRKHLLIFEDIAEFPDREMQTIVRELKTDVMARTLFGAPPEVINKFFANMSERAVSALKEEMEYTQELSQNQIEEERTKVMDVIKALEKEGKISVRKRGQQGYDMVEGMQEELGAMERRQKRFQTARQKHASSESFAVQAPDPIKAQAYFDAAVSQYQSGQTDAAIPYFEAALALNAFLWQAHQYLGAVLYQKGDIQGALSHYEKVLERNPDPQMRAWVESFKLKAGGNLSG
jgi:flagellar motor switch protein FliG